MTTTTNHRHNAEAAAAIDAAFDLVNSERFAGSSEDIAIEAEGLLDFARQYAGGARRPQNFNGSVERIDPPLIADALRRLADAAREYHPTELWLGLLRAADVVSAIR